MSKRLSELGLLGRLPLVGRLPLASRLSRVGQLPLVLALPLALALLPTGACNPASTTGGGLGNPDFSVSGSGKDMVGSGGTADMSVSDADTNGNGDGGTQPHVSNGGCIGRQCQINYNCPAVQGPTSITGVVTIPAGTLPINNAIVYIPSAEVPPVLTSGASCNRCDAAVPADAAASTTTDINGRFTLNYVPSGSAIPLVISVGKWRRVVTIPAITDCTKTSLVADQTRLPRNQSEGNIPKFALSTGRGDGMECLLRSNKLGLDDSEFTNPTGTGRVNLYAGGIYSPMANNHQGVSAYSAALGGAVFPTSQNWWETLDNLKPYDIIMLSCESAQDTAIKSANALTSMQRYLNMGGRVFASHFQNYWISGNTAPLNTVATFVSSGGYQNDSSVVTANINQSFDKGVALANWLQSPAVGATQTLGQLPINASRVTLTGRNAALTTDWVDFTQPIQAPPLPPGKDGTMVPASQYFSFNTPVGASAADQCGEMVFTDMHVTGTVNTDTTGHPFPFPDGCTTPNLTPQEKALIFLLFDLSSCLNPT